ncbi:MAG: Gfo/Idh/MocA family oxidoreductase [Armatimonadetes bacterium]|nr:Gfo/Idh/MocA family oxidoreductase [Armatimonadota bacterium]
MADNVTYQFEYPPAERIRVGYIGCGGHSFRNVYPAFQYAPVELVAVCDLQRDRAEAYRRQFGAERAYDDHRAMLEAERLDAVFVVTSYDAEGHPLATPLASEALRAGCHVWMEKPPVASVEQVRELQRVSAETGRFVMVGLKKMFNPAVAKLRELLAGDAFGPLSSIAVRYPQGLPENTADDRAMLGFLDHIAHPGAVLQTLAGPVERMCFEREPATGATVTALRFVSGAVGTLHLTAGQSGTSPLERIEVVGRGANAVIDNGATLTVYRRGARGAYGRADSYLVPDDQAPLRFEPEFSLGQLYNKGLFLLGYVPEVRYFCQCVKEGRPPAMAGLDDVLEIWKLYGAFRRSPGTLIRVNGSDA